MNPPDLQLERQVLDNLDGKLLRLLIDRKLASSVAQGKKARAGLPVRDPAREAHIMQRYEYLAPGAGPVARAILNWCCHAD
ncbi:MAG: chorismate mutase [Verrucomicrobiales bacterium]|nr:chorismate mutase [Verrucomicrobiales bacterium]